MIVILLMALQTAVPSELTPVFSRLDTISRYPSQAAICTRIGYTITPDFTERLMDRAVELGASGGATASQVSTWLDEGSARSSVALQSTLSRLADASESDDGLTTAIKDFFEVAERRCLEMASDPILSGILQTPSDPRGARIHEEDKLLADLGAANWQTPHIWAIGELMMAVGACKGRISSRHHDQLIERYLAAGESDQVDQWVRSRYIEGLRSEIELDLNEVQCDRLMATREAEVSKRS